MHIEHHSLVNEFPEHRERLHALKLKDLHFARMVDAYHELDQAIVRAEDGVELLGSAALEDLKKQRLALKDTIYARLVGGGCGGHSCSCGGGM